MRKTNVVRSTPPQVQSWSCPDEAARRAKLMSWLLSFAVRPCAAAKDSVTTGSSATKQRRKVWSMDSRAVPFVAVRAFVQDAEPKAITTQFLELFVA